MTLYSVNAHVGQATTSRILTMLRLVSIMFVGVALFLLGPGQIYADGGGCCGKDDSCFGSDDQESCEAEGWSFMSDASCGDHGCEPDKKPEPEPEPKEEDKYRITQDVSCEDYCSTKSGESHESDACAVGYYFSGSCAFLDLPNDKCLLQGECHRK